MRNNGKGDGRLKETSMDRYASVGEKILENVKKDLFIAMRGMFAVFNRFDFIPNPKSKLMSTDGENIYFNPMLLVQKYTEDPVYINRAYLHISLHCLFLAPFTGPDSEDFDWNLAADIHAESIIDSMDISCILSPESDIKESIYKKLRENGDIYSINSIYNITKTWPETEKYKLAEYFYTDDHSYWYKINDNGRKQSDYNGDKSHENEQKENPHDNKSDNNIKNDKEISQKDNKQKEGIRGNQGIDESEKSYTHKVAIRRDKLKKEWSDEAKKTNGFFASSGTGDRFKQLARSLDNALQKKISYRLFLKKFMSLKEDNKPDLDSFDMGYYNYGISLYKNIALIEETEVSEEEAVDGLVIAVDTSGSCSGDLVERFVNTTYGILKTENVMGKNTKIYIIECDNIIQRVTVADKNTDIDGIFRNFSPKGCGGTDFRPVFEYINDLLGKREIKSLRGLIYFTDGRGVYPKKKPAWKSAFVYSDRENGFNIAADADRMNEYTAPSWVIKYTLKDGIIK